MAVVAVLEIHMDKNAVGSMNPSISLGGLVPMSINTLKIMFLEQTYPSVLHFCRLHRQ